MLSVFEFQPGIDKAVDFQQVHLAFGGGGALHYPDGSALEEFGIVNTR